jgi:dTDP-4-dehydrorhamnose 3,5-epimerase
LRKQETEIEGCFLIDSEYFQDDRGYFMETYQKEKFSAILGKPIEFLQDNLSVSRKFVLRGLHYQKGDAAQAKLVRVTQGRVLDVVVDIRKDSLTFGKHFTTELSESNRRSLFIPHGMAHGFLALEDQTIFSYKCDAYYDPGAEGGIIFNDADLGIDWGIDPARLILSDKDLGLPSFKDIFK